MVGARRRPATHAAAHAAVGAPAAVLEETVSPSGGSGKREEEGTAAAGHQALPPRADGRSFPGAQAARRAGRCLRRQEARLGDTVLVVDDNATVRMFMKAKLAPFGFEVDYAETGEDAVGLTGSPNTPACSWTWCCRASTATRSAS
jgi:twitching motility two-component system response regulator PilG